MTLPSNVALCMNPNEECSLITANGERYVMAKALIQSLFDEYEIIETKTGKEYEGMKYEPLFDYVGTHPTRSISLDTYVTLTDGTVSLISRRRSVRTTRRWV